MDRPSSMQSLSPRVHRMEDLCLMPPAPEVEDKLKEQFERLRKQAPAGLAQHLTRRSPQHVGLNDGLIFPGTYYPTGTTAAVAQRAALERTPLRGQLRVIVVLVDFSDRELDPGFRGRFQQLFFSDDMLLHGSVAEYFTDVSRGQVEITGEVVGPYRMPHTLVDYAGSDNGTQSAAPNARTMADDALTAAEADVNFSSYDNDGNGYVDAFIVVHAGRGAEQTNAPGDIWSHKWILPRERSVDGTKVYAYLTIPEDAMIGVAAHELGHLLFGWPDLYDTDGSSSGVGNWCLMSGGSWGLNGERPVHPSAWCKITQGWATPVVQTTNATVTIPDVKTSGTVYRLWKDGAGGNEYFLVENRQQTGYDASLPGEGLLVWHIDEAIATNTNEDHPKVALEQADGQRHLESGSNRGDAGDPFPGSSNTASFTATSTPNSKSYAGSDTCVSITGIPASSASMTVEIGVTCLKIKEFKDLKERPKEIKDGKERPKELIKEFKEGKERPKELIEKDQIKELEKDQIKDGKERLKELIKDGKEIFEDKRIDGKFIETHLDHPLQYSTTPTHTSYGQTDDEADLSARLANLEATLQFLIQSLAGTQAHAGQEYQAWDVGDTRPFINNEERPNLGHTSGGPEVKALRDAMEAGSTEAKAHFDNLPPQ